MTSLHEVVVTGMGVVAPIGVGMDGCWQSIRDRKSGVRTVPELAHAKFPIPIAGDIPSFDPKEWVKPRKSLKVMSREMQLGFAAAEMAWAEAKLEGAPIDPERLGVTSGSNMYCPQVTEFGPGAHACDVGGGTLDMTRWGDVGLRETFPLWLLKYLPNMTPAHISIARDARGPSNCILAGDVSGLLAIIEAADVVARGHADVMIAGGASSLLELMDLMWHNRAGLSRRIDEPERACRPFDACRDGMVGAEGAAMLVLERREHAEARGATPIARILGFGRRNEPVAHTLQPTGEGIRAAIRAALESGGCQAADVGFVSAHGLSTVQEDRNEATAIAAELGDVPVTAPKSFFGNVGPACGAVELAIGLAGMRKGLVAPTLNYDEPDPECPVNVVGEVRRAPRGPMLVISHRQTGQAVTLLVEACK